MKTLLKILIPLLLLSQSCKAQDLQKYVKQYEDIVPKLQPIAAEKQEFYNQPFSEFMKTLENSNIKIDRYGYDGKEASSPKIYIIRIFFISSEDSKIASDKYYQQPFIVITFQDEIPFELRALTRKYYGEFSPEVKDFLANRKIESMIFYGLNGFDNKDRTAR